MNERTEPRLRSVESRMDLGALEKELTKTAKEVNTSQVAPVSEFAKQPRKTAAGVTERYALAAKAVLSMGDELRERIRKLEEQLAECDDVLRIVQEASDSIREKGTHAQLVIDEAHATAEEIRDAVSEILQKLSKQ